jgi:2-iminobutanoate/2-iminopropanoate deaminase
MKKIIHTDQAPAAVGPYSQAVEINGTLYVSGQVPINPATGKIVPGGIAEQTLQVMKNIGAILEAAGYRFEDVVKSTCLLTDMSHFSVMNNVYSFYYPEDQPARAAFRGERTAPRGAHRDRDRRRKTVISSGSRFPSPGPPLPSLPRQKADELLSLSLRG